MTGKPKPTYLTLMSIDQAPSTKTKYYFCYITTQISTTLTVDSFVVLFSRLPSQNFVVSQKEKNI